MAEVSIKTSWADSVNPSNVHTAYPRPQMEREEWKNLNGMWQFQEASYSDKVPLGKKLSSNILVPFPWESALSGVQKQYASRMAWYKRSFTVPENWKGKNILLNFGAINWEATIYLNGSCVEVHKGGYDPFSVDITPFLNKGGENELIVHVFAPANDKAIPSGKQDNARFGDPRGFYYCPSSGIWQTVWLEAVPATYIQDVHIVPDIDNQNISVTVYPSVYVKGNIKTEVQVWDGSKKLSSTTGGVYTPFDVKIPEPKLWSPSSPFLYDLIIVMNNNSGGTSDTIKSYCGMRKISLEPYMGAQRIMLNNKFLFQFGPLDQGFWPGGLYSAPTDNALQWELGAVKSYGFNMIRKVIKVEPQLWYYWCDKLGLLVWQGMPSTFKKRTEVEKTQYEIELQRMIKSHWNHPSIVNWIIFNEHWGLYDVDRLTKFVKALDPTKLVTGNSGLSTNEPPLDYEVGDIKDVHNYLPPATLPASNKRAVVNGEYGAIGYKIPGHLWDNDGPWVHYDYSGKEAATEEYLKFINMLKGFQLEGLSGAVYTQWTDVENELNGVYTADRKVEKLDKKIVTEANKSLYEKDRMKEKFDHNH